ncbi:MAG TPA: MarR family transcriptional regulator [Anaerolineales bacterium]|nr:MarR family transcriptional regulator [Anaerolineales bacterium]
MMSTCTQEAALEILSIVPHIMRTVAAELRRSNHAILPGHYHVLGMLAGERYSLSEIADRQHVSLPTTSRSISTLVERGWVERVPDVSDRRITRLALTAEGETVLAEIHQVAAEAVTRQLAGLTPQACRHLVRGLAVLHQAFEQPGPGLRESSWVNTQRARSVGE